MQKPFVLIVLDGWGLAPPGPGNAISQAKLVNIPKYWSNYPHAKLTAHGAKVGLPVGEDGNTEVGHVNIGGGRVVYQDLPRINMSISDGSFFQNTAMVSALSHARKHQSNIHVMGLLSDSGVHASRDHLYAILEFFKKQQCEAPVYIHLFTDGRDSPRNSALRFVHEVEEKIKEVGIGKIATVMGRYWGMDRDHRWDRTEKAYRALTEQIENRAPSASAAVQMEYDKKITDEFIEPTIITDENNNPLPRISGHDSIIFYNYRIDRPRQLTRAFVLPDFETNTKTIGFDPYSVKYHMKHVIEEPSAQDKPFTRRVILPDIFFVTMTDYERNLPCVVAFPLETVKNPLGRVFSDLGVRQLRVSETEKERFVGYYFNGKREEAYQGEDRMIVPSPRVATYDLLPQMSAIELTNRVIDRLTSDVYSFVLINFANPDMVGHTGNIHSAITAVETTDACVGKIVDLTLQLGGACIITADHGNVEEMLSANNEVDTEHSTFPVPFIMIDARYEHKAIQLPDGKLGDVAPTILAHLGITKPAEMTGTNLLADLNDVSIGGLS
jgi:2,3-bisphosphoglycerate-independent phosphoglycerate mutase